MSRAGTQDSQADSPVKLCLFGAAGDTGNLGVSALLHSIVVPLQRRLPELDLIVFDTRKPQGPVRHVSVDGDQRSHRVGVVRSGRRFWSSENLTTLAVLQRLRINLSAVSEIRRSDAVLDISGGDSFTDIYGPKRFGQIVAPKTLALRARTPLILLPQTYGEFEIERSSRLASEIVRNPLTTAWSRDKRSHEVLVELAGAEHDPSRHLAGVDVAFGLEPVDASGSLPAELSSWIEPRRDHPVAGINISGLLYNDPTAASRYRLSVDYRSTVRRLATKLLRESDARIVLMPHVNPQKDGVESDPRACGHLFRELSADHPDRVCVAPAFSDPGSAKWLIGSFDWFMGSRMHSTIAALSSNVVAAALAYSMKTYGVFESCDMAAAVVDGRSASTDEAVEQLWQLWLSRDDQAEQLRQGSARVRGAASSQMDDITSRILRYRSAVDG